jgi:arsenate reductase-like glutaredoxin family protein
MPDQPTIQVFGRRDSRETQKALRFFRERRLAVSFVDVAARPPAPAELRRFAERLGAEALLDREGRRYGELGLGYLRMGPDEVLARLRDDPALLRLPLVRRGSAVTAGVDEPAWRAWIASGDRTQPSGAGRG